MVGLMPRPPLLAALVLCCAIPGARADEPGLGSVRLPLPAAELATALGIHRVDPSTLPLDIVRLAFASPDKASGGETAARATLAHALARKGEGDLIPLPLPPRIWREHILRRPVRDDDLAAAIFASRTAALVYHALFGMDRETLAWIERNPAVVRSLAANPGTAAAFATSIRIRDNVVDTPGEESHQVWKAIVGADPAQPPAFVARLLSADNGAIAGLYHTIARLDPARQVFAIGRGGEPHRTERLRDLLAASRSRAATWTGDRPFMRPDIDLLLVLRTVAVDARGAPRPPAARALWSKVSGEGPGGDASIDAAWIARHVLDAPVGNARRRLDAFRFAQHTLGQAAMTDDLVIVLREHARFPLLMAVLDTIGERDVDAYAAAARAADLVDGDDLSTTIFQSSLALVDRARRAGSLTVDEARTLSRSLVRSAAARDRRRAMAAWLGDTLVPTLRKASIASEDGGRTSAERAVLEALAGRRITPPIVVRWEDSEYVADLASAELRRLDRIRRRQGETPLDAAMAQARNGDADSLANSLAGLVYACALGEAEAAPINAGAVWKRHRFRGAVAATGGPASPWRLGTEVFTADGWYVAGSLLRLDLALAPLALRRIDTTEMPAPSHLSTSNRRTLASTIALIEPLSLTDADRDAIAAALARGRDRLSRLASAPADLPRVAGEVGLSGWRETSIAWLLANDPSRVAQAFTLLEQWRAGGGAAADNWGAAAWHVDGCLCVRQPAAVPWEDYSGRSATGQLGAQFSDVLIRVADVLAARQLPALLARDVAAYAMQDTLDRARTAYFDDWLPLSVAVRELPEDRFVDYVAALTAGGPLVPRSVR